MAKTFLKAEWRKLAMINYEVDPHLLQPYLPYKTEIDFWNDKCYVSLVGFMFLNTKVRGFAIPFHTNFEEVNLRFYVLYKENGNWKRGVTFIKEIVPKYALTFIANTIYREKYETMPMKHSWKIDDEKQIVEYKWRKKNKWNTIQIQTEPDLHTIDDNSEEAFITEHYWGYTKIDAGTTAEYGVEHPKWQVYKTKSYAVDVSFGDIYGQTFDFLDDTKPTSVFLAEGSLIEVKMGKKI